MPILKKSRKQGGASGMRATSEEQLTAMIEEATVDANDMSEQALGLYAMLEDHLALPFETMILGVEVTVEGLDLTANDQIVAICGRDQKRQRLLLTDLPIPCPAPKGAEWIDAYRKWTGES